MLEKEITFDRFIRGGITIAIIAALVFFINYLSSVLIPFFIAWLLAYMIYPIVEFFQYKLKCKNRILSIILTLILISIIIAGIIYLIVPPMIDEIIHLKNLITAFIQKGANNNTVPVAVETFIHDNLRRSDIQQYLVSNDIVNNIKDSLPKIWNLLYRTADMLISIISSFITLLYLFFILLDYDKMAEGWIRFIPSSKRLFAKTLAHDVQEGMSRYFRGQGLIALCVGILFSIGFLIIGFPLAIPLGMFIGLLNLVPYLQLLGFIPTIILALLKAADTGQNFWIILGLALLVFLIVQTIQDFILTPHIMGKFMGLSPAIILFSLSIWGYLLGIIGLIIALPLTNLITAYYKRYIVKD